MNTFLLSELMPMRLKQDCVIFHAYNVKIMYLPAKYVVENQRLTFYDQIKHCTTLQMFAEYYWVFAGIPFCGETLLYLKIAGKSYNYHGVSLQSVNITGFIHNIYKVSL
jgi:hypothetical protein